MLTHLKNAGVYVFVIERRVSVEGNLLDKRDGAGFWETDQIDKKY